VKEEHAMTFEPLPSRANVDETIEESRGWQAAVNHLRDTPAHRRKSEAETQATWQGGTLFPWDVGWRDAMIAYLAGRCGIE
jgi:hypothetical protein